MDAGEDGEDARSRWRGAARIGRASRERQVRDERLRQRLARRVNRGELAEHLVGPRQLHDDLDGP